jgi:hypothetical protein
MCTQAMRELLLAQQQVVSLEVRLEKATAAPQRSVLERPLGLPPDSSWATLALLTSAQALSWEPLPAAL